MAVSLSDDLQKTSLVFQQVRIGSLHNLLHNRHAEFPLLGTEYVLSVVLQVCEGLLYLHSRGLVMRALSSHSVILTSLTVAKLTGLGFMVPSEGTSARPPVHIALPPSLYRWAAPEVMKRRPCTGKADLYSLSALIQEIYTDKEPWGAMSECLIKQLVDGGEALGADLCIPQPYYDLVRVGLQPQSQDRTCSLRELRYKLRLDIKFMKALTFAMLNFYEGSVEALEPEAEVNNAAVVKLDSLKKSRETKAKISSIMANRRECERLHKLAMRSLDVVENYLQSQYLQFTSSSGPPPCSVSFYPEAFGPPSSEYHLLGGNPHPAVKRLEAQLQTGEFSLMSQEDLAFWLSQFPAVKQDCLQEPPSQDYVTMEGCRSKEEPSLYSSALDDSFVNMLPHKKLQVRKQLEVHGPEGLRNHISQDHKTDEVTDLVTRMTLGQLRVGSTKVQANVSKDSEEVQALKALEQWGAASCCSSPALSLITENLQRGRSLSEYETVQKDSGETAKPVTGAQAQPPLATNLSLADSAELVELSSITCSPTQHQQKLYPSPLQRPLPPCNSTPRSPELRLRVMGGILNSILLDSSHFSSTDHNTGSFTTARDDPRDSSPPSMRANFPSSLQDFSTASQMDGVPTDTVDTSSEDRDEEGAQLDEEQKEEIQEEGGFEQQSSEELEEIEEGLKRLEESSEGVRSIEEEGGFEQQSSEELEEIEEGLKRLEESSEGVRSIEEEGGKCLGLEWRQQSEDANTEEWPFCLHSELTSEVEEEEDVKEMVAKLDDGNLDPDSVEDTDPAWASGAIEDSTLLDVSDRAHSTLDEVLQGIMVERSSRSPGPGRPAATRACVYEGQAGEDAGNPGGDHADRDEHKDQAPPLPASSHQAEKLEAAQKNLGQPHRTGFEEPQREPAE
ncbi:uncharacterized protein tex14 [Myripristis murdjan]|uniref:uncharacterized protein tex14 n=1 Tax=Myripristis murdjan TaxID=586833 RepID=UPI00117637F9|nr:inactive serine/threonine-protein kinase TEX14 [Myripristis murdjan]